MIRDRLPVPPRRWRDTRLTEIAGSVGLQLGLRRFKISRCTAAGLAVPGAVAGALAAGIGW
jgi:hypothetical protein